MPPRASQDACEAALSDGKEKAGILARQWTVCVPPSSSAIIVMATASNMAR
jgi:hypothetical protein